MHIPLPHRRERPSTDPRVDIVAAVIRAYYRLYGRPLRGTAKLAALLAALMLLDPETGAVREKPLPLNIDVNVNLASLTVTSGALRMLIDEAVERDLVRLRYEPCYESDPSLCDDPPYTRVYLPGRRTPRLPARLARLIERTVAVYGRMDARQLVNYMLAKLGFRPVHHNGAYIVSLHELLEHIRA